MTNYQNNLVKKIELNSISKYNTDWLIWEGKKIRFYIFLKLYTYGCVTISMLKLEVVHMADALIQQLPIQPALVNAILVLQ